jgi:chemotaxis protein MotB
MPAAKPRGGGHGARGRRHRGGHGAEHDNSERWLVTYADMLTVLLALFIVLFAISTVNTSKFNQLKASLAATFGDGPKGVFTGGTALNDTASDGNGQSFVMPGTPVSPQQDSGKDQHTDKAQSPQNDVQDVSTRVAKEIQNYKEIEKAINDALAKRGMTGAVEFSIDRRGLIITVVTNALVFPGNSATLLTEGHHILDVIAPPLLKVPNRIEVDGHTNQENVSTYPYPSGWELSSARASAVVRALIEGGVAASRLTAVGYSDQRPLVPPDDPRSVTRNRRVEIVVLSTLPAEAADMLQAAGSN